MSIRVFTTEALAPGIELVLDSDESHYLARVRRSAVGHGVEVLDGRGSIHLAKVVASDPRRARVLIGPPVAVPPVVPLELALGLPEPRATLESVTHACEAGATTITFVRCERSHAAVPSPSRVERVVRAALRQCGRPLPPRIRGPIALGRWLDESSSGVFAWTTTRGQDTPVPPLPSRVLVGPEGGLTDAEAMCARARGLTPIALGPWVLRTPTAVIAALTRSRYG